MKRFTSIAAVIGIGAALAGFGAPAASAASVPVVAAGPVPIGKLWGAPGYRLILLAALEAKHARLQVVFVRTKGEAQQTTDFSFVLPRGALRIGRGRRRALLDTRDGLGRFGRIRMTFVRRGSSAALTGALEFRTGRGRVHVRSMPAKLTVEKAPGAAQPTPVPPSCHQYPHAVVLAAARRLKTAAGADLLAATAAIRPRSGPIQLAIAVTLHRPPSVQYGTILAVTPRRVLALQGTRSAILHPVRVPFVQGRVTFSSTGALPGCARRAAVGAATGTLRARLDLFGSVPLLTAAQKSPALLIGPRP